MARVGYASNQSGAGRARISQRPGGANALAASVVEEKGGTEHLGARVFPDMFALVQKPNPATERVEIVHRQPA